MDEWFYNLLIQAMKEIIFNCQTGEITERELTSEEIAQMEAMQNEVQTLEQQSLEQQVAELQNQLDELRLKL